MAFLIILLVLILILFFTNVRIVPQAKAYVIERLGKYKTTWEAGLRVKMPLIDRVAKIVSLKEQVLDFPPQPVITKDNVVMQIDSVVFCKVFDPALFTYGVENPMSGKMQAVLDDATDQWGIKVTRVEIKNINPPREIEEVMTKQMRAERERRQTVLEAQAHQEAVVSRAEGDKKAKILSAEAERDAQIALAEGKAKSIRLVYEAEAAGIEKLNQARISEPVLKLKGIQALKDVADGRATKIYMPSDIASSVSSLGLIGEAIGIGDATPIDKTAKAKPAPKADPCIDENTGKGGVEAAYTTQMIQSSMETQN